MRGVKQKEMFKISDLRRREILHLRSVWPFVLGRGRRLGQYFWVQNFEFQYFFLFRKLNIFGGMKIL